MTFARLRASASCATPLATHRSHRSSLLGIGDLGISGIIDMRALSPRQARRVCIALHTRRQGAALDGDQAVVLQSGAVQPSKMR